MARFSDDLLVTLISRNPILKTTMQILTLILAVLLLNMASAAMAQQMGNGKTPRVPVTIALVASTPDPGAASVVLRRADIAPHDVILLRADSASAQRLSNAVVDLLTLRRIGGDTASAGAILRVAPTALPPGQARRQLPWAARVMNDLREADSVMVPGVGEVQAVRIWLPPQKRKP